MTVGGSVQLRQYRRLRRSGATMMTACADSGIVLSEARLIDAEDRRNPPPEECFELLITAPVGGASPEEDDMARPRKAPRVEQVHTPDYALAVKIYREDIKPAISKVGEFAQEQSTAYKEIKRNAHIQPQAAKTAFKISEMEEAKRDDYLRCLNGLFKALGISMPRDLVDAAEGKGDIGEGVIPAGERPRPKLVTIPTGPADDSDLNPEDPPADAETDEGEPGADNDDAGDEHTQAAE